jgi:hypothetical protein
MANDITTHPHLWSLDTVAAIKAAGYRIHVRHVHYEPAAVGNECVIGEYAPDGTTVQNVLRMKAHPSVAALPIDVVYDRPLQLNGMYLATISAGTVYVMVDLVEKL